MITAKIIVRNEADIVGFIFNPFDDISLIRPQATRAPAFLFRQEIKSIKIFKKERHKIIPSCITISNTTTTIIKHKMYDNSSISN
jgi:hypothetical protein